MNVQQNKGEIVIYQMKDGQTSLEVNLVEDTVWLSLNHMVALFDRDKSVISRHIKNIFREGELDKRSVVAKYATTASDEKTYQVEYFNLDVIISVGYRVKSQRGTQFRIWANKILKDYLVKGYTLNENRLQSQIEKYTNSGTRTSWKKRQVLGGTGFLSSESIWIFFMGIMTYKNLWFTLRMLK